MLVHLDEDQVRVEGLRAKPRLEVFREDLNAHLDGAAPDRLDLGAQDGDLTDLHGMQEIDVVHGAEKAVAAGDPGRGHVPDGGDPLHHATPVDLPGRSRVLGEHPLDHLGDRVVDR